LSHSRVLNLPLNQILIGDAFDRLLGLPSNSIDTCLTSPIYFQKCDYEHAEQYGLEPTIEQYMLNLSAVFTQVFRVLKPGGVAWIIVGDTKNNYSPVRAKGQRRKTGEYRHRRPKQTGYHEKETLDIPITLRDYLREIGWMHRQTLIWDKGSSGEQANSDTAATTHEFILQMGKWIKGSRPYLNCKPLKSSVLKFAPAHDEIHPCPFPVDLASHLLSASSEIGQVVLDPFMGSGTTGLAAKQLGRSYIGIELNPIYRQNAINRIAQCFST
jgi:site-specific DNA-methyltransferase (cytosine-N4-specific)